MSPKVILVNIEDIVAGDTIIHNGNLRTVTRSNLANDKFLGRTLFGDSYNLGVKKVKNVLMRK